MCFLQTLHEKFVKEKKSNKTPHSPKPFRYFSSSLKKTSAWPYLGHIHQAVFAQWGMTIENSLPLDKNYSLRVLYGLAAAAHKGELIKRTKDKKIFLRAAAQVVNNECVRSGHPACWVASRDALCALHLWRPPVSLNVSLSESRRG